MQKKLIARDENGKPLSSNNLSVILKENFINQEYSRTEKISEGVNGINSDVYYFRHIEVGIDVDYHPNVTVMTFNGKNKKIENLLGIFDEVPVIELREVKKNE